MTKRRKKAKKKEVIKVGGKYIVIYQRKNKTYVANVVKKLRSK